jgi:hypothetical protein
MMTQTPLTLVAELLQESAANGRVPFLTLVSDSMAPLLRAGDQVGLEVIAPAGLQSGDLIVLRTDARLVTHRFWGRTPAGLITRGDRPLSFDAPWSEEQLVGRVISRRRAGRELWLQRGRGRRLNHHLFWLARQETKLFAGRYPNPLVPAGNGRTPGTGPRPLAERAIRRVFYIWSWLATGVASPWQR